MTALDPLREPAVALVDAAHAFHHAAETPGSHLAGAESLASMRACREGRAAIAPNLAASQARGPEAVFP